MGAAPEPLSLQTGGRWMRWVLDLAVLPLPSVLLAPSPSAFWQIGAEGGDGPCQGVCDR